MSVTRAHINLEQCVKLRDSSEIWCRPVSKHIFPKSKLKPRSS